ncbi:MAG: DUF2953 domain-containing protein [Clostridiaceae bacterium]|nr:DUF2953 domain-containing protein [Clostridiaceae bacterium]
MLRFAGAAALVIGAVLLALIVLLLLALLPRVRVDVEKAQDGPLGLTVGYGWLRLRLLPRREKPKPAKKASAKPKPEKEKKASGFSIKGLDIGDAVCLLIDLLIELRNRLVIHRLRADVLLATGDAAKTGILLGRIAAICGMVLPFLEQNYSIPDFHISVDGDFQSETSSTRAAFAAAVSMRPIHLPLILLKYRRQLLALYRSLRTGGKISEPNEPTHPQDDLKKENVT